MFSAGQMNKRVKYLVGVIGLSLLPFLPNYSLSTAFAQTQQQESALESIIKNSNSEIEKKPASIIYNSGKHDKNYVDEFYKRNLREYMQRHIEAKEDMANRVPLKWLNIMPESMMGGVLGFTYLGENSMGRRADLTGKTARMVDIHESIHTPDEYETRVLTSWIMEKARSRYIK